MFDQIEDHDIKNSVWISIFVTTGAVLAALIFLWFYHVLTNEVVLAEKAPESENIVPTSADIDKTVVQIANATNRSGFAGGATRLLESKDFVALDAINTKNQRRSEVFFQTDPVSRQSSAEEIARILGIPESRVKPFGDDFELAGMDPESEVIVILAGDAQY